MCFALIFFYEALFMHATIKLCPKILQNFSQSSQEKPVLAKPFDLFKAVSRPHIFYFFVGMWLWTWKYAYIMTTFFFLKKKSKILYGSTPFGPTNDSPAQFISQAIVLLGFNFMLEAQFVLN